MKEHKVRVIVLEDGKVVVDGIPVTKGQHVEVIIRVEKPAPTYPLRGLPVQYKDPLLPAVPESEWDAPK